MARPLKIIPLGGLGEIGMNSMLIVSGSEAILVDCGVMFADLSLPGIDLIVPDFSILMNGTVDLKAIVLTHGHEDHIGAIPYLFRELRVPIFGSRFTLELVKHRLREHELLQGTDLQLVKEGDRRTIGPFDIEFIQMSHSIADALALAIHTDQGVVVHTGDFKIDARPADGRKTDLPRFQKLGDDGVFLLFSDSTNVEVPGRSISESSIRKGIETLVRDAEGWVVVASFASHIPRLKQVFEIALECGRKVHIAGRSMITNIGIAREHGFLKFPDNILVDLDRVQELPRNKVLILSTGTQGEIRSALSRMALNEHKELRIRPGDRVILSSRFIPGNERAIYSIINHLYRRGAHVFTTKGADVHVSGHAYRDDLADMLKAVRPKHFIPVHGEYRHLVKHIELAREQGVASSNTFLMENGHVMEFRNGVAKRLAAIELNQSVVDGNDLVEMGSDILRDRRHLSATGIIVAVVILDRHSGDLVRAPELLSRGFKEEEAAEDLLHEATRHLERALENMSAEVRTDDIAVQEEIRLTVRRFFRNQIDRKPVVIPIVLEV